MRDSHRTDSVYANQLALTPTLISLGGFESVYIIKR